MSDNVVDEYSTEYLDDSSTMERFPYSRLEVPDPLDELRQTIVDQTRGDSPSTVMGVLLEAQRPTTPEAIAGLLGKTFEQVDWTLDVLEKENLVIRYDKDSIQYALAFSQYSE